MKKLRINFLVNPVFDGWEPTDARLGGTERAVVEWAQGLTDRGHTVNVYRNGSRMFLYEPGPSYFDYDAIGNHPCDVWINIKSPDSHFDKPTLYYTNEMNASELDLSAYDGVIHISQYAKDNIPVNNPNVFIVPHGYDEKLIYPDKKIPKQCLYASSPDRGLDTLLEAWPIVYEAHPDATLLLTYGGHANLPGVIPLGDVDEDFMNELYRTSQIWCHPANGGELFCITGIKAQAAGCWPVYFPTMALSETVKFGTKSTPESYAKDLINALDGNFELPNPLPAQPTIKHSTDKLLEVIDFVVKSH